MNARSIRRAAVDSSLRLVRLPLDVAIGRLPGNGTGARPSARLAVDRTDATLRWFAGIILSDPVLREDAELRRAALRQREHAQELRGEAQQKTEQADARLEERQDQVARQRRKAEKRANSQSQDADREREARTRAAEETERKRSAASDAATARADKAISERAPEARLETLDARTDALVKKDEALTADDEARRLSEAASHAKAERKGK